MTRILRHHGFSLIELMIAMLIGLLLVIGITSLFTTTASVNRMENGLARLQENGRFALDRIAEDIRMASATRGSRKASEGGGAGRVNPDRPLLSFADFGGGALGAAGLPGATESGVTNGRYFISPAFMLRGAECRDSCSPANIAVANRGWDTYNVSGFGVIPDIGTGEGSRAAGADVLTLRYLRGTGVALSERFIGVIAGNDIKLESALTVGPSAMLVIGDYATTAFVPVTASGTAMQFTGGGASLLTGAQAPSFDVFNDVRVSDFDSDFVTVSYYLRLENDPSRAGRMISALRRRENGVDVTIAEGIERLDFIYHVEDRAGNIRPMTADEVAAAGTCPDASMNPPLAPGHRLSTPRIAVGGRYERSKCSCWQTPSTMPALLRSHSSTASWQTAPSTLPMWWRSPAIRLTTAAAQVALFSSCLRGCRQDGCFVGSSVPSSHYATTRSDRGF